MVVANDMNLGEILALSAHRTTWHKDAHGAPLRKPPTASATTRHSIAVLCMLCLFGFLLSGCGSATVTSKANPSWPSGPVYVVGRWVSYEHGDPVVFEYEHDERGTVTAVKMTEPGFSEEEQVSVYSDFTSEGYPQQITTPDGNVVHHTYTIEDGHLVSDVTDDPASIQKVTYHPNGMMKSFIIEKAPHGNEHSIEYDENGYITRYETWETETVFDWNFDSEANPIGYSETTKSSSGDSATVLRYSVQCDEAGNITSVRNQSGEIVEEITYVKIDNPSGNAWIGSHRIPSWIR